jgi:hypothetical protein
MSVLLLYLNDIVLTATMSSNRLLYLMASLHSELVDGLPP